jgi:hypothetical protein
MLLDYGVFLKVCLPDVQLMKKTFYTRVLDVKVPCLIEILVRVEIRVQIGYSIHIFSK